MNPVQNMIDDLTGILSKHGSIMEQMFKKIDQQISQLPKEDQKPFYDLRKQLDQAAKNNDAVNCAKIIEKINGIISQQQRV